MDAPLSLDPPLADLANARLPIVHTYKPIGWLSDEERKLGFNMIGLVTATQPIAWGSNDDVKQTIRVVDETTDDEASLSFDLVADSSEMRWLPGSRLKIGHVLLVSGLKFSMETGVSHSHEWRWVAYDPQKQAFYAPEAATCLRAECELCPKNANTPTGTFSPTHRLTPAEKELMLAMPAWWKWRQSPQWVPPPKTDRVRLIEAMPEPDPTGMEWIFADVLVEILGIDRFDTRTNTATIYVTDWTRNAWLRQEMTSVRVERQSERRASQGRRFVLRSALKGMLLPIVLHDVFAEISVMFQVGQLYRLRNLPLSYRVSNEYGHLKGEMKTWHEWKLIDVQEVPRSSQDRDVVELSRRRTAYWSVMLAR